MTTTPDSNQEPPIDPRLLRLLEGLRPTPPRDPEAATRGKERFLAELNALDLPEKAYQPSTRRWLAWWPGSPTSKENISMNTAKQRYAFSTLVILLAALIFLFGGASVTAYASQSALPGDTLYPFKTTLEQTRVALAGDAADQAELHLTFAQRRLDEIQRLIAGQRFDDIPAATQEFEAYVQQAANALQVVAAGDPVRAASLANKISAALSLYAKTLSGMLANIPETVKPEVEQAIQASLTAEQNSTVSGEIEFTGRLEGMAPRAWTVAGRTVAITPQTEVKGTFQVGDIVKVHAFMAEAILTAREIETGDDNTNDNTSGNENEAGNANVEDNGNSNSDDRGDDNSNSGGNGNPSNENSNEQGDDNANDQDNTNNDDGNDNTGQSGSGGEVRFSGSVQAMEGGQWTIGGKQVQVTSRTELRGQIRLGDTVEVRTVKDSNGNLVAYRIELVGSSGSQDNSNANSDDSSNTNSSNSNSSGSGGMDDNSNSNSNTNANTNDDHGGSSGGSGGSGGSNENGGSDDNGTSGGDDSGGSDDNSNNGG